MAQRAVLLLSLVGMVAAGCTPRFVGEQRLFVVENAGVTRTVPAVEGTVPAEEFYNYIPSGSSTGLEKVGFSQLFLYRDMTDASGKLDLFWINGRRSREQRTARVRALISGVPEGVTIAFADERNEFAFTTADRPGAITGDKKPGPRVAGNWAFVGNSDGGVLSGFEHTKNWELEIRADLERHAHTWQFLFGDESEPMVLDDSKPAYLRTVSTTTGPQGEVQLYPQEADAKVTYCGLATGEGELEYTFSWGDGSEDTVVRRESGKPACATHKFCGTIAQCGGDPLTHPRVVKVSVRSTDPMCANSPAAEQPLAVEEGVCFDGVAVRVDDVPVAPTAGATPLQLHRVPEQFAGMEVFVPSAGLRSGEEVKLECCGADDCSFVVSTYHCPPCSTGANGGFPSLLPADGFTSGSCSPRFDATSQKMTSFHITVPAGGSHLLPATTTPAPYVAIFGKRGVLAAWCPTPPRPGCGGPCPPVTCVCDLTGSTSP